MLATVNMVRVAVRSISGTDVNHFDGQSEIASPLVVIPTDFASDRKAAKLDWFGDVYVAWKFNDEGAISECRLAGPDEPENIPLPAMNSDLDRSLSIGSYFIKLGTVPEKGKIERDFSGHIQWSVTLFVPSGST